MTIMKKQDNDMWKRKKEKAKKIVHDRKIVDEYQLGDGEWLYEYEMYDNNEKKVTRKKQRKQLTSILGEDSLARHQQTPRVLVMIAQCKQ